MYTVHQTPTYLVDHEHLDHLRCSMLDEGARAVVVGWGEYAKHLVNYFGHRIAAVYDPRQMFHGITFRGVPVIGINDADVHPVNRVLAAEYEFLYDFLPRVHSKYPVAHLIIPPRMQYKPSGDVKVFDQEALYKHISRDEHAAPAGMMIKEKIQLLVELMRFGLTKSGSVVEMGSWQGSSAWYMAKALKFLGEDRKLYMMDLFEDHMMDPTATMCSDEIRVRLNAVYDGVRMIQGLIDDPKCLAQLNGERICFAHVDLGFQPDGMNYLWEHMSPGAPILLDNYGHLMSTPWAFDGFFESRGARVIRFPWSEQGLAFKST